MRLAASAAPEGEGQTLFGTVSGDVTHYALRQEHDRKGRWDIENDPAPWAFDAGSGDLLWTGPSAQPSVSPPAKVNGRLYVGLADGNLYAYH